MFLEVIMERLMLNLTYIAKLATKWTGAVFAFVGVVSTFASLSDLFDPQMSPFRKLLISASILAGVWIVSFAICAFHVLHKRRIEVLELNSGHHVYVQYGDIFSEEEVLEPNKRRNIVIPVNRCFDTLVDDDLVSSKSLHGIAMNKLYHAQTFTQESLNEAIRNNLALQQAQSIHISESQKRKGNLVRYRVGSVAEIIASEKCTYFFLGLTVFDENLKASVSNVSYVAALMRLLEFCNTRSQGFPVVIPLIGGGMARTGKSERDILKYMICFLNLYKDLLNCDIHIVVRDSGKGSIAITDL